jgi:tetratricopeptide (TPR) repeat protein
MRTPAVVCLLAVLGGSLLPAATASAQPKPPPAAAQTAKPAQPAKPPPPAAQPAQPAPTGDASPSLDQQVIQLFDKGAAFFQKSQWVEAETAFQAAWDLKKSYDIAGNLGEVELKLGQTREAATHLSYSLRHFPATGKEAARQKLQQLFEQARKETVTFQIRVNVDGAQISVSGRHVGTSPLTEPVFTEPGPVILEATLAGHEPAVKTIQSAKGWSDEVELILKPKPEKPVIAGPRTEPPKPAGFFEGKSVPLILTGAGLTTGLLLTGFILTAAANGKSADAGAQLAMLQRAGRPCSDPMVGPLCKEQRDALRSQSALANGALAVFLAGGVTAAATTAYLFWPASSPSSPQSSASLRPLFAASPGGGGVWVAGTF